MLPGDRAPEGAGPLEGTAGAESSPRGASVLGSGEAPVPLGGSVLRFRDGLVPLSEEDLRGLRKESTHVDRLLGGTGPLSSLWLLARFSESYRPFLGLLGYTREGRLPPERDEGPARELSEALGFEGLLRRLDERAGPSRDRGSRPGVEALGFEELPRRRRLDEADLSGRQRATRPGADEDHEPSRKSSAREVGPERRGRPQTLGDGPEARSRLRRLRDLRDETQRDRTQPPAGPPAGRPDLEAEPHPELTIRRSLWGLREAKDRADALLSRGSSRESAEWSSKCLWLAKTQIIESVPESLESSLHLNRSLAYLRLERWVEAEEDCQEALRFDSENPKALYRRALARLELGKLEGAFGDVERFLEGFLRRVSGEQVLQRVSGAREARRRGVELRERISREARRRGARSA